MVRIRIPNVNDHYEMDGLEIDVDSRYITIRDLHSRGNRVDTKRFHNAEEPLEPRRAEPEQENMSILSSLGKISRTFGKKK